MRYGDILPKDFNIPTSAFWLKGDLGPKNPFKQLPVPPNATVMDCGSFIGTFAAAALEQGAVHVTCYEAAPKNAELLRENMARYVDRVTIVQAALIATNDEIATLTMSGFSGANSILPSTTRMKSVQVKTVNFRRELLSIRPQMLKLDIEGAEYDLLASLRPGDLSSVESLFIEFHPIADRDAKIKMISSYISNEGMNIVSNRLRAFIAIRGEKEEDLFDKKC
jgi:FkbM family methyltransferase